jgi:ferredoxin-NADP reductase
MADNMGVKETVRVRVHAAEAIAEGVVSLEFGSLNGEALPSFEAGAHIEVFLPTGIARCYSLTNPLEQSGRYKIAVQLDPNSRGGSEYLFHQVFETSELKISYPRNLFPLVESAAHVRLIAGGIGITPLWSMAQVLERRGGSWDLFYAASSQSRAAFAEDLKSLNAIATSFHFDDQHSGKAIDLHALVRQAPSGAHFYCCGPIGMLKAFEAATSDFDDEYVHLESFGPLIDVPFDAEFDVELAKSARTVRVGRDQSILEALIKGGINARYMCANGVCGECETRVLEGIPDHRDSYLTPEEKSRNDVMMICCSGAKTQKLVLDL